MILNSLLVALIILLAAFSMLGLFVLLELLRIAIMKLRDVLIKNTH